VSGHRYGPPDPQFYRDMKVTVGNPITGEFEVPVHPTVTAQFLQRGMIAYEAARPKCTGDINCPATTHLDECLRQPATAETP